MSGVGATAPPQADGGITVPGSVPSLWTGFSRTASDPRPDCSLSVTNTGQIHERLTRVYTLKAGKILLRTAAYMHYILVVSKSL